MVHRFLATSGFWIPASAGMTKKAGIMGQGLGYSQVDMRGADCEAVVYLPRTGRNKADRLARRGKSVDT
jgi:hypothetical protein